MSSEPKLLKRKPDEPAKDKVPVKIIEKSNEVPRRPAIINPIKLNVPTQDTVPEIPKLVDSKVREVFNSDEESEEEEIPTEARIRMRNLGRYTPTSCGPNSFGKGRFGFVDRRALLNKQTEALNEAVSEENAR
ncbi:PEST proteolytic signal-containing nuclear protein [Schistosoma japonicum]|uniref:PEST proteolytic signal-containing nuclear protein n=1 Tax=Schistosoma japonicum TaxID=6182 RepID=C1LFL1_SCHJA|nr:PEST proteolytic signal-containing nuclear protein [Schistosoma japonicum]CAX73489.1 PEST proteolytic signal containing nuclear protein [Schistosoma japonicum]